MGSVNLINPCNSHSLSPTDSNIPLSSKVEPLQESDGIRFHYLIHAGFLVLLVCFLRTCHSTDMMDKFTANFHIDTINAP